MSEFTAIEQSLLDALLDGDDPELEQLRAQLAVATVRDRELTESGQFTDLWVEDEVAAIAMTDRFAIDDVFARVEGVDEEVCVLLHVVRGRIKTLEVFVLGSSWPASPTLAEHWYVAPDDEDAGQLTRVDDRDLDFALRGTDPHEAPE